MGTLGRLAPVVAGPISALALSGCAAGGCCGPLIPMWRPATGRVCMCVAGARPAAWPNEKKLKKAPIDAAFARPKQSPLTEVEPTNLIQVVDFTSLYHP